MGSTLHSDNYLLLSQTELFNDRTVALDIGLLQVAQKISSVTNHLLQAATAVVVLVVALEVFGQILDSVGQKRDLYLGRTGVAFVCSVSCDDGLLFFFLHCHDSIHLS